MSRSTDRVVKLDRFEGPVAGEVRTGTFVGVAPNGRPQVDFPGNPGDPVEARVLVTQTGDLPTPDDGPIGVLLTFDRGDVHCPIIIGVVRDTFAERESPGVEEETEASGPRDVLLDGKRMVLEANEEIVLRCGKSSITLRRDGKVVIKGIQVVSRAAQTNKIKGGSVSIN